MSGLGCFFQFWAIARLLKCILEKVIGLCVPVTVHGDILWVQFFHNCLHMFSESLAHFLITLNTKPQTQNAKLYKSQSKHCLQNCFISFQNVFFFCIKMTQTHSIIWMDPFTNQNHTDQQVYALLYFQCYAVAGCKTLLH